MKTDKNISKLLTQNLNFLNGINGGVAMTTVEAESLESGILLNIQTPSLQEEHFEIELNENLLVIKTIFPHLGENGFLTRTFPLIDKIDKAGIEASFEEGILKISLPYSSTKLTPPTRINIRKP
ncbi:Hsp20/alpha crystallin family protein [Flexithrix dorotheae]|uniref:Hsp20/alpha crystallin family protein n=1 Tax=Flexithrix dorotheae TaxID=70993 RepID=UPI0003A3738C|nr:Hsp20/alpha crystallin family protein [Flexithrix dorotheae]